MRQRNKKKFLGKVIQLVFIAAILFYLFKGIDFHRLFGTLMHYSFSYIFLTLFLIFLSYVALSFRWNYLMGGDLGIVPSFETAVVADFLNIVLPARIGDLAKVFYLKNYYRRETHNVFSVLFIERFLDINVLFLFTILISLVYVKNEKIKTALILLFSLIVSFIFLIKTPISKKLLRLIPFVKLREYGLKVVRGIDERLTLSSLGFSMLYTAFLWTTYFLKNILFFKYAVHFDLSLFQLFILFALSTISFVLPVTPGGVGTYQASIVFVAGIYGIPKEDALAAGVVLQGLQILMTTFLFGIIFFRKGLSISSFKHIKEEVK